MSKTKGLFSDAQFNNKLRTLATPIAFQYLMLALVAVADALMLGRLDQNSMASVSLATQVQFIQNILMSSSLNAASVLGSQYWGKGDKKTVQEVFRISIRVNGLISIVTFVGCVFFSRQLMTVLTNDSVLLEMGARYLRIAGWSYLCTGISQCYMNIMKVTENPKTSARISTIVVFLNIGLNAILIFGLFGLPKLGIEGAAIATLIARIVELVIVVTISFMPHYMRPDITKLLNWNKQLTLDYWKVMYPILGAGIIWGVGFASYTAFMGHLGQDAAAANSVTAVARDVVCCVCDGIAIASGIMVANELGAGDLEKGKLYGNKLVIISFLTGLASTVVMLAITPLVIRAVKLTPQARHLLIGMMLIMSFYMIGRCVNTITITGVFAAGGDTMFDLYSLIVAMWCLAIPLAVAGTFFLHWPVLVVYACTCLDEVGKIPWVIYHHKKYKWVRDLTR